MSKNKQQPMQCPECGATGNFLIWESVNTNFNPDMKDQIISGEIFSWTCPRCRKVFKVLYPFLYHDMEGKKLIEFRPTPPGQQRDTTPNQMYQAFIRLGYSVQYAYTPEDLARMVRGSKIRIHFS